MAVKRKSSYGGSSSNPNKFRGILNNAFNAAAGYAADRAIQYGINTALMYGNQPYPSYTATEQKRLKRFVPGRTNTGVLAGKIRPRRNARWIRRKGRRPRRRPIVKRLSNGASVQVEAAGSISGDKCLYVGHTTALPDEMLTLFIMACMKNVLVEAGISINSWSQSRTGYVNNGDVFQFVYKISPTSSPSSSGVNHTVAAANVTFFDIVSVLFGQVKLNMGIGLLTDGNFLTEFQYVAGGRIVKVNLQDARFNFSVKSSLKIQNRSVVASGDDEVDVNNVPVYGKLYSGTGNGFLQRTVDDIKFLNGTSVQAPVAIDGSAISNFAEPPSPVEFTHCRSYSKAYINPGQIKTNVMYFKSSISVNTLWIKFMHYYVQSQINEWFSLGKFAMFGLERVIAKLAAEPTPGMQLTYEIDSKLFGTVRPSPQKFTAPHRIVF